MKIDVEATIGMMFIDHMNNHMDQALEFAVYVLRYPVDKLVIKAWEDKVRNSLVFEDQELFYVEMRKNKFDQNTVDTYIGGELAEFVTYNKM